MEIQIRGKSVCYNKMLLDAEISQKLQLTHPKIEDLKVTLLQSHVCIQDTRN